MRRRNLLAFLALLAFPHFAAAQDRAHWSWSGTVPSGGTVAIHNVLGRIQVVRTTGKNVVVNAEKHARRGDTSDVKIEVVQSARGVTICSVYLDDDGDESNACDREGHDHHGNSHSEVYVDYTVQIPDNLTLDATTVVGDVDATDLRGDVDVGSVTGDINVNTTGEVSARTVSGDIRAGIGVSKPQHSLEFSTVSGDVTLELPRDFSADLRLRSQFGKVESDFAVAVEATRFGHTVRGRIGAGGSVLSVSTLSGRINLRQVP